MIRLITFLIVSVLLFSCNNQNKVNDDVINNDSSLVEDENQEGAKPAIEFERTTHNFGEIVKGEKKSYAFKFTNTGDAPLIINQVIASCGCTAPYYPKEPIMPGESGFIKLKYDSSGQREDKFQKNARVMSNTVPNVNTIYIEGKVVKK
jgi:hypothetical protein